MSQITLNASSGSNKILNDFCDTWADAVAGLSGTLKLSPFTESFTTGGGGAPFSLSRTFLFFDLTSLKPGAIITAATLIIPAVANYSNNWNGTLYIVSHTNTDPVNAATTSFFNNVGNQTTYGSIANSAISTSTSNNINLTTAGIAALLTPNIGGHAPIGMRHSSDINGVAGGSSNGGDQFNLAATNYQLQVTYSVPGAFLFNLV